MASVHREAIQKQIQQDWANREYIEVITGSIKKITDFLNSFGNQLTAPIYRVRVLQSSMLSATFSSFVFSYS